MAFLLKHQTAQAFVARFREAYRDADRERCVRMARFLIARIQSGDLTEAQVQAAFGKSNPQWTAFKNKLQSWITAENTIKSAVGE